MLAFEPPHFGPDATIGGVIAAGLSGPRRASSGAVRDFMLGARLLDGRAQVLSFGGRVMKNVAGYDVSRLFAGSLGIFGVILEASIKVLPRPPQEITLRFEMDEVSAIAAVNRWAGQPLPLSASTWSGGALSLRLSGSQTAVTLATAKLGGQVIDALESQSFWEGLREQTDPFFAGADRLWRLSVPSTSAPLALAGRQLIEWGGAERWLITDHPDEVVRGAARAVGGHASIFRGGDRRSAVFMPLAEVNARLHRGLKQAFDPKRIFCRGRLYPDF
jgi:glycolate oxidase FAD binding subunit